MNVETTIAEGEISSLVERFYAKVRVDPEIGPVFNDVVQNWDAHLALLKDFWSTVLLTTGRYKGNPLLAHFPLPIEGEIFFCSLAAVLFSETAHEVMPSSQAAIVTRKADLIAMNMNELASRASEGGGASFQTQRTRKSSPNVADRLRKYQPRFGLDWNVDAGKRERRWGRLGEPTALSLQLTVQLGTQKGTKRNLVGPPGLEPGTNGL